MGKPEICPRISLDIGRSDCERGHSSPPGNVTTAIYGVLVAVAVSVWFIAIGSPLWLDETGSYWAIKEGLTHISSRPSPSFPGYYYILGLSAKLIGTSEIALRVPSALAMLGAAYLLYLAARELLNKELALFAVLIFCLDPIVVSESIDARPYAFAVLATSAAILALLRLRRTQSNWAAVGFGALAASPLYFHTLFGTLPPALFLGFFIIKGADRKLMWKQFAFGISGFILAFLPLIPRLLRLMETSGTHVFSGPPRFRHLVGTITLGRLGLVFAVVLILFMLWTWLRRSPSEVKAPFEFWKIGVCLTLALVPLLLLFGVSIGTPLHLFTERHRLSAIPAIALCWALIAGMFLPRKWVLGLAVALVAVSAGRAFTPPINTQHGYYTWKYALDYAEKNAAADNAPLVICSDFPESDYVRLDDEPVRQSRYFSQLAYYPVTVPVVPLPRLMNHETVRIGTAFLSRASAQHQRFLALAYAASWPTLQWLAQQASPNYTVKKLGVFSGVEVLEFQPRPPQ